MPRSPPLAIVTNPARAAAALQTVATRQQQSIGYTIALGLEATAAALLGALVLREPMTAMKLGGIGLVAADVWC